MRLRGTPLLLTALIAACGDDGSNDTGASDSASGTGSTGAAASTSLASTGTGEPTPTTADDGTLGASESQATTGTGTDSSTGDATIADASTTAMIDATGPGTDTGDDTSTGEPCVDECVDGEPQCVGDDALQVCGVDDRGCLAWAEPDPCEADQVCKAGACVDGCVDACDAGSKQCSAGGVASCVEDPASGCTVWSDPVDCAAGKVCDAGACITPPDLCKDDCVWTKQAINASVDLYSVWGSGAKAVWTVGASGTALYYNGVTWKAVDTGVGVRLDCVHGSAADDVYAISHDAQVIRWDGEQWLPHVELNPVWGESACLSVIGSKDLLASVFDSNGEKILLYRIKDGIKSLLTTVTPQYVYTPDGSKGQTISLHAFSAAAALGTADRAYRWDGVKFGDMFAPNPSFGLWALAPDLAYAAASHSGIGHRWDGAVWKIVNPGLNGYLHMFSGTAKDRVFGLGETKVGANAAIVAFDGIGWSPAAVPGDAKALFAGWSAATGEVFAVGKAGTILIGK